MEETREERSGRKPVTTAAVADYPRESPFISLIRPLDPKYEFSPAKAFVVPCKRDTNGPTLQVIPVYYLCSWYLGTFFLDFLIVEEMTISYACLIQEFT